MRCSLGSAEFCLFAPAFFSESLFLLSERNAGSSDNYTEKVAPVRHIDNIPGVHVFSDEHPIKNRNLRRCCRPHSVLQSTVALCEKKIHFGLSRSSKSLPAEKGGGVA